MELIILAAVIIGIYFLGKYAIEEVSKSELDEWKRKSNGRLTFRILPTSGLPTASSLADTSPY